MHCAGFVVLLAVGVSQEDRIRELVEQNQALAKEVAQLRTELTTCRGEMQAMERLARPSTREEGIKEAGRMLAGFYRWVAARPETRELTARQELSLLGLHGALFEKWAAKNPARRLLIRDTHQWMRRHLEELARRVEFQERESICHSPELLLKQLEGTDRAELAKKIAAHIGQRVSWSGTITRFGERSIEFYCDGVLVIAQLRRKHTPVGLKLNGPIYVRGRVAEISGNTWVGVVVEVGEAEAAADPLKLPF